MDLSGLAWYPSCTITSGKVPLSGHQCTLWFICLCVGYLSAVFTTSHHHLCSTEASSPSLLSSACSVTTSTNIERHSHCPQCQGYPISIIYIFLNRRTEAIFFLRTLFLFAVRSRKTPFAISRSRKNLRGAFRYSVFAVNFV